MHYQGRLHLKKSENVTTRGWSLYSVEREAQRMVSIADSSAGGCCCCCYCHEMCLKDCGLHSTRSYAHWLDLFVFFQLAPQPPQPPTLKGIPADKWRVTEVNKDYSLCPTYPKYLIVPTSASDDDLRNVARFRSKGRLPGWYWYWWWWWWLVPCTGAEAKA